MNWLARLLFKDRRNLFQERRDTERHPAPKLEAYYWSGAVPKPHSVRDIGATGAYLVTEERWDPGTVLMMTLQSTHKRADGLSARSIRVRSKVVRWGTDGVGLVFVFTSTADSRGGNAYLHGADRKMFADFVRRIRANSQTRSIWPDFRQASLNAIVLTGPGSEQS
jgi:hypothetical protein